MCVWGRSLEKASFLKDLFPQTHAVGTWAVRPQGYNIQDCSLSFGGRLFTFYNWKTKLAESQNTCIGLQELVIPGEMGQAVVAVKPARQEGAPGDLGSRFQSKGQSGSQRRNTRLMSLASPHIRPWHTASPQ